MTLENDNASDEELARQSQAGSLAAFEELMTRHQSRIHAFVWRCCRHETDAREITQDTFVRAFEAIRQFDPAKPFAPWLFTIARRKCVDSFRAKSRLSNEEPAEQTDPDNPADTLARNEDAERLWDLARKALSEVQFQALWLRYVEDMNIEQISGAIGKTRTHVKIILFRARQTLAEKLDAAPGRVASVSPPLREVAKQERL